MGTNPPKPYTDAESAYVRQRIAEGSFDDPAARETVNELLRLEEYVLNPPEGFGGGLQFGRLRNSYPDAYDAIQGELAPETFRARRERERERRAQRLEHERAVRDEKRRAESAAGTRRRRREWAAVEREVRASRCSEE